MEIKLYESKLDSLLQIKPPIKKSQRISPKRRTNSCNTQLATSGRLLRTYSCLIPTIVGLTCSNPLVLGAAAVCSIGIYSVSNSLQKIGYVSDADYALFLETHSIEKCEKQDLLLIIQATQDKNGAFIHTYGFYEQVKTLENEYKVAYAEVTDIKELVSIFKSANQRNQIKNLYLRAHGQPLKIALGENKKLTESDFLLLKETLDSLDKKGCITLDCCSVGARDKDEPRKINMAELFALACPGVTVFGPTENIASVFIKKTTPLKVEFFREGSSMIMNTIFNSSTMTNYLNNDDNKTIKLKGVAVPSSNYFYCQSKFKEKIKVTRFQKNETDFQIVDTLFLTPPLLTLWNRDPVGFIKAFMEPKQNVKEA